MVNPTVPSTTVVRQVQKYLQFAPTLLEAQFFQWCLLPATAAAAGTVSLHPSVQVRKSASKGFDLVSLSSIPPQTEILKVPREYWEVFSAQTALEMLQENSPGIFQKLDAVSKQLLSSQSKLGDTFMQSFSLAFYVAMNSTSSEAALRDEVNASVYFTMLRQQSFPVQTHYLPHTLLMSTAKDIDPYLQGMKLHRDIMIRKNMYEKLAMHFVGAKSAADPLVQDFLWAMGLVLSRALSSPTIPFTMIPILDFANHGDNSVLDKHKQNALSPVNTRHHFDAASGAFSLITDREIHPQESLCISYGPTRDTSSFVTLYGFLGNFHNANDHLQLKFNAFQDFQFLKNPQKCEQVRLMFQDMIVISLGLDLNKQEDQDHLQKLLENYQVTVGSSQVSMSLPLLASSTSWSAEELEEQGRASMQMMVWLLKLADLMEHAEATLNQTAFQELMATSPQDWQRVDNFLHRLVESVYTAPTKFTAFDFQPQAASQGEDVAAAFADHLSTLSRQIEPTPSFLDEHGEAQVIEPKPLSAMEYWKMCCARVVERELREVLRLRALAKERS